MGRLLNSQATTKVCAKSKLLHAGPRKEWENYYLYLILRVCTNYVYLYTLKKIAGNKIPEEVFK